MMTDPNATIVDAPNLVGQIVSDRYEVLGVLGDGSMGIVFLAEHTHMKKRVALKVMRPEFLDNPEAVERFQREAQATGHIDHPHVCISTDFGRLDDERFFLVMEYLEGHTLSDVLAEDERLVPERAVNITRQIASGLQRAHELGVIHRDLKPDNIILIDREGNPDFVKITDFGVARVEVVDEQKLTRAGTTMGTPVYMSPEQAVAKRADERSDLYTLGVMLFQMLTGSVPFYSQSLAVILSMHTKEPPPAMHEVAPDALIPNDLVAIVEKLLSKKPEERYQSAGELIEALDRADLTPYVPGLGGPPIPQAEPITLDDAGLETIEDVVSGADAFGSDEALTEVAAKPIGPVKLPGNRSRPGAELPARLLALPPAQRYGIIVGVLALLALPMLIAIASIVSGDDEPVDADGTANEMAFTEDDVRPEDLASEREEFIDDHDLTQKLSAASPDATVGLLQPLLTDEAENPHLHYLLGRALFDSEKRAEALKHYEKAIALDPRYAVDPRVVGDAVAQFDEKEEDAVAAKSLITALLDTPGAAATRGALYDLAIEGNWGGRKRARELLEETGQAGQLEPWQVTAMELLGTGKNCERIKKLVGELEASGAPGALPALERTARRPREGCGFLNKQDCYKCARGDLKQAIETLKEADAPPPAAPQ